jgi:hypothetical protein
MLVTVRSYSEELLQYTFNSGSELVETKEFESHAAAMRNAQGMGGFIRVGFRSRRKVFFALYTHSGRLFLHADSQEFELSSNCFQIERKAIFLFTYRFSVLQGEHPIRFWIYYFPEADGFPENDILLYFTRRIGTERDIGSYKYFWTAASQGRNPLSKEFQVELGRHLGEHWPRHG